MKFVEGLLALVLGLIISLVAGYFSVIGLGALFAAAFWPVVVMGASLEAGKIMAASWLKANWRNSNVGKLHKAYLLTATFVLMMITALGIYGYLAKGHLEQEAPLASVELQIAQIEDRINQAKDERTRLEERLKGMDQSVNVLLGTSKNAKEAQAANRARAAQAKDRAAIQTQIDAKNKEINALAGELTPLRLKVSDVSAKLGPVKYVANLFGWEDPNSAVQLVIVMIMFAFDPLAVALILSGTMSIGMWFERRASRKNRKTYTLDELLAQTEPEQVHGEIPMSPVEKPETTIPVYTFAEEPGIPTKPLEIDDSEYVETSVPVEEITESDFEASQPVMTTPPGYETEPAMSEKELLLKLLEKNPDVLQAMIEEARVASEPAPVAVTSHEVPVVETPVENITEPLDQPSKSRGWLDRPWFGRDDK